MIFKEQFLELKHLKSLGVPTTTIAKKIGISVPNANKWLRMDEDAFENYLINNTPYLAHYVREAEDTLRTRFTGFGGTDSAIRGSILSFPWRLRYPQKRTTDVAQQRKSATGVAHTIPNVGYELFNMNISGISKKPFRSNAKTKEYKLRPTAWKKEMTV